MQNNLDIVGVSKSFDGQQVLREVSLHINRKSIVALFGENGSGKSTLFNIICGFAVPDSGQILYNGRELAGKAATFIARAGIGRVWQTPRVFKNLTVVDNLSTAAGYHPGEDWMNYFLRLKKIKNHERHLQQSALSCAAEMGLSKNMFQIAGELSFGQQKLLSLGMLLMNGADTILLDEPFAGVSVLMVNHICEVLDSLREAGKAICIIEHNRSKARQLADECVILEKGKILKTTVHG